LNDQRAHQRNIEIEMMIKIGANPICWSNDDMPEVGDWITLEECLSQARDAGFSGMELGHKFPREAGALKDVLDRHSMTLVSGWHSSELLTRSAEDEITALEPHLNLLKALGAKVLIFSETSNWVLGDPLSKRPVLDPSRWAEFGRRVTAVAEHVLSHGIRLVYHHHLGSIVQSEAEIYAFMAHTGPAVHLLLDTAHAYCGGADPVALAREYRERISHVHAKDVRESIWAEALVNDWSFREAVLAGAFTVPGDGCLDYRGVLGALGAYSGWVVVEAEQDPLKADPAVYTKMGYANLKRFANDVGLQVTAAR
jgi:inosose dehydratase